MSIEGLEITDGFTSKKLMFCVNCNTLKVIDRDDREKYIPCNCESHEKNMLHKELQLDYFKD